MPPVTQPRGLMEYANEASNFKNSQQQNQLNNLKLQYAPQQMEMQQKAAQQGLQQDEQAINVQKQAALQGLATDFKARLQSAKISDPDQAQQYLDQYVQSRAPYIKSMGFPMTDRFTVDQVMQLAGPTAQEQAQAEIANEVAKKKATFDIDLQLAQAKNKSGQQPVNWTSVQDGAYQLNPQTGESRATGVAPKQTEPKPLQEWQVKQVDFLNRTTQANDIIENIGKDYSPSATSFSKWTEGVPLVGKAVNAALSPNEQQINQAQRQFINSTLRRESGAAIGKDEFESAQQQYFPMPNDSAETLAQKAQARAIVIQGLKTGLPENLMPQTESQKDKPAAGGNTTNQYLQQWKSLPSGAIFTTPEGKKVRKP